ncbi:MAG: SusC/RagA family protein, partial [Bacteroidales bacterium]|nr:SusC/RagA family protein [Bacteroidales bacterium]
SVGNKLMNYVGRTLTNMNTMWSNQLASAVDRAQLVPIDPNKAYPFVNTYGVTVYNWFDDIDNIRVGNPSTGIPRAVAGDPNENARISDRYIEDGSYVRIKNVSLAYNLPNTLTRRVSINKMKVYVNVQNLWTFTKYTGLDPEVGASQTNDNVFGMDNGRYPAARVYTFGLNFAF